MAAHGSKVCSEFSGVKVDGGGTGRTESERFEDEDPVLVCELRSDIMRVTVGIVLRSASDRGHERGRGSLSRPNTENSNEEEVKAMYNADSYPAKETYRDMRAKPSPAEPGIFL